MAISSEIVQKLWNLCHVLRDDGIIYFQYVIELTYLLFLKMMEETGSETQLPEGKRWSNLKMQDEKKQLDFYRQLLLDLGSDKSKPRVKAIFDHAQTGIKQTRTLKQLITKIDELDWYSAKKEDLGDIYEGLLEKNAGEKKSGAGQYFTPRPLIDCIVSVMKPQAGELIQDPAAGTGGFLVAANRYIEEYSKSLSNLSHKKTFEKLDQQTALSARLSIHGRLSDEESETLRKLTEQLSALGFNRTFRDPLEQKFAEALYMKQKEEGLNKTVLTKKEQEDLDKLAMKILTDLENSANSSLFGLGKIINRFKFADDAFALNNSGSSFLSIANDSCAVSKLNPTESKYSITINSNKSDIE